MIKRILIPVDFSETSRRAAKWAIDFTAQIEGEALAVTVLDVGDLRVAMGAGLHGFETDEDVKRQVNEWVESEYAKIIPKGTRNVRRDLRRGVVEREIIAAVEQYEPDLIVMGSEGLARHLPLGSKTEYVIRHCTVPVVVMRPPR